MLTMLVLTQQSLVCSLTSMTSPRAGMATAHTSIALLAAPAIPGKHVKVLCLSDFAHILGMVCTDDWQLWAYCIVCFQHFQYLEGKAMSDL